MKNFFKLNLFVLFFVLFFLFFNLIAVHAQASSTPPPPCNTGNICVERDNYSKNEEPPYGCPPLKRPSPPIECSVGADGPTGFCCSIEIIPSATIPGNQNLNLGAEAPAGGTKFWGAEKAATAAGYKTGLLELPKYLGTIAGVMLGFAGGVFVLLIVWGGILIMTAAGEPGKFQKGKNIIVWAIIGAIIIGLTYALADIIIKSFE